MNLHGLSALEYPRVKELVLACLKSSDSRKAADEWKPAGDLKRAEDLLEETSQMASFIEEYGQLSLEEISSLKEVLECARPRGSCLTTGQIMSVGRVCLANRHCRTRLGEVADLFPLISGLAGELPVLKGLEKEIRATLDDEGEFRPTASENLQRINKEIAAAREEIDNLFKNLLTRSRTKDLFQDDIVTTRQGRYVLMVKSRLKGRLPGIIHDRTDSGAAVYLEPQEAVPMNNRLIELFSEEEREKKRILRFLTDRVRDKSEALVASTAILGQLDLIQARALYGLKRGFLRPRLKAKGDLEIRGGRHPVLEEISADSVVPLDLNVQDEIRALIITGPNTGGKTVALKTVGLLCLMAQSGLFVPAGEGTSLPVFSDVFADIGDEQSVEQSLSTFSAHIKNIAEALREADERALIILDELGAGTDPGEGAHLAMAIIEELIDRRCMTLASTHHEALWAFASVTPAVDNASMEFDGQTLKPTYRLIMGVPGRSNAREVARQMGIPGKIVERAGELLSETKIDVEELLSDLDRKRKDFEKKQLALANREGQLSSLIREQKEELESIKKHKDKMITGTREETAKILREAKKKVREIIAASSSSGGNAHQQLHRLKKEIEESLPDTRPGPSRPVTEPRVGQMVFVPHLSARARIVDVKPSKKNIRLEIEGKKVTIPLSRLEELPDEKAGEKGKSSPSRFFEVESVELTSSRLNIRGMRGDEAAWEVERFLDRALLAGLDSVEIIHGKGLGRLKKMVQEILDKHPRVMKLEPAPLERGGYGVTVVKFK